MVKRGEVTPPLLDTLRFYLGVPAGLVLLVVGLYLIHPATILVLAGLSLAGWGRS